MSWLYKAYTIGKHPKPRKQYINANFLTRHEATSFCKDYTPTEPLFIVYPNGKEQQYDQSMFTSQ